jgi:hypothetical protein
VWSTASGRRRESDNGAVEFLFTRRIADSSTSQAPMPATCENEQHPQTMQLCRTAVHRQTMGSMDRGVQAGQTDAISAGWPKVGILGRYSSTGRYRYRRSTTTEVLREFDTELQGLALHMSASRASFVFPTSLIPLPVRRQCLRCVDGRRRMGRRAATRAEGDTSRRL